MPKPKLAASFALIISLIIYLGCFGGLYRYLSHSAVAASRNDGTKFLDLDAKNFPELFKIFATCGNRVEYWRKVPAPTAWYSDAYGIHVIKKVPREKVIDDFVKSGISRVIQSSDDTLELEMDNRFHLVFFFGKVLRVNGYLDKDHNYIYFKSGSMKDLIEGLNRFHQIAVTAGLDKDYFEQNPNQPLEKQIANRWKNSGLAAPVVSDPDLVSFPESHNSILIVPDPVHGNRERYEQMRNILATQELSWFGIEMFPRANQIDLNTFLNEAEGTEAYEKARQVVLDKIWHGYFPHDPDHPENNLYYKLIELSRKRHIPVFGLDGDGSYALWNHGESPFGASVRSWLWADTLSTAIKSDPSGLKRGVVFAGSGHFDNQVPVNVQEFLKETQMTTKIFWYGQFKRHDFFLCPEPKP